MFSLTCNDSLFFNYFRLTITEQFNKFNSYTHCEKGCLSDKTLRLLAVESKSSACFSDRSYLCFVTGLVICALRTGNSFAITAHM